MNFFGQIIGYMMESNVYVIIQFNVSWIVINVLVGDYFFCFIVCDDCGNINSIECFFWVLDFVILMVVCDDFIYIILGGDGIGILGVFFVDEGSFDNCGLVILQVR